MASLLPIPTVCLDHPGHLSNCGNHFVAPLPGSTTLQIKLVEPLSTASRHKDPPFPEVWKVQCGEQTYVARIYDPLYVEDDEGFYDIFLFFTRSLVNEYKAYELLKDVQGNLVPRYIGSFLSIIDTVPEDYPSIRWMHHTPLPPSVPIPEKRSVFVTLLQYIPGEDLRHSSEWSICAPHKAVIRRSACIAGREFLRRIWHYDLAERNTILKAGSPSQEPFCDDVSCKLRWQTPTTLLRELHPSIPSPITIIDMEDTDIGKNCPPPNADGDYDLNEKGPRWLSKYWFS
ncbi:hypothetical protein FB45DRAFT_1136695 [Roridomyces roridus]|uniref:Protein kinase domain-containing protein n=1 Tax=Roridomyces roridus TaxID=1738132 RepID=A0AAD7FA19_9AGAR|nr:hypothetical protein FB45DRAFT_1136695 [Roridomyces roridus]